MLVHNYRETATDKCSSDIKDSKGDNLKLKASSQFCSI